MQVGFSALFPNMYLDIKFIVYLFGSPPDSSGYQTHQNWTQKEPGQESMCDDLGVRMSCSSSLCWVRLLLTGYKNTQKNLNLKNISKKSTLLKQNNRLKHLNNSSPKNKIQLINK